MDQTDATWRAIAALRPALHIEDGDTFSTHCQSCATSCTFNGKASGTASATIASEADSRIQHGLHDQRAARRSSAYAFRPGNHEGFDYGAGSTLCSHDTPTGTVGQTSILKNMTNANDTFPHGGVDAEDGHYYHHPDGQVSRIFLDEYAYACTEGETCTNGLLPDGPEDWTIGTGQKAWLSSPGLIASLGNIVVVTSHHAFAGCPGGSNCYGNYGRIGPLSTTDGLLGSDWNGPEEWLHDWMAARVAEGRTLVRIYGHDHKFGYITTREGVHYFVVGSPGGDSTGWVAASENFYGDCWDVDADGSRIPDYVDPFSIYYAPVPAAWAAEEDGDGFYGFLQLKYTASNSTSVELHWWGGTVVLPYTHTPRFSYTLDGSTITRSAPSAFPD